MLQLVQMKGKKEEKKKKRKKKHVTVNTDRRQAAWQMRRTWKCVTCLDIT